MYKPDSLGATSATIRRPVSVRPGRADSGQSTLGEATALSAVAGAGVAATAGDVVKQGDEAGHSSCLGDSGNQRLMQLRERLKSRVADMPICELRQP